MTHSVMKITCNKCSAKFNGVLNDLFNISKEYAATCPKCEQQTFFMGGAAIIDADIPKDAVKTMYVKNISSAN